MTLDEQTQLVRERVLWAKLKLSEAKRAEVFMAAESWTGYLTALQWVEEALLKRET